MESSPVDSPTTEFLEGIRKFKEKYLEEIHSTMPVRDYLAAIWSLTHGAAAILNSSFYQRYLGSRDTLRVAYIDQALALPKHLQEPHFV